MFTKHMMGQHVSCSEDLQQGNKEWWKFLSIKMPWNSKRCCFILTSWIKARIGWNTHGFISDMGWPRSWNLPCACSQ
jgi:hypothetical protein